MKELGHLVTFLVVAAHFRESLYVFMQNCTSSVVGFIEGISKGSYEIPHLDLLKAQERGLKFWDNLRELPQRGRRQSR